MPQPHILLLGAHGRISLKMIPLFLKQSWNVTALIRDYEHTSQQRTSILQIRSDLSSDSGVKQKLGNLDVLVHNLSDIKTSKDAQSVIDKVKGVNWIVWSAGAGGKQGQTKEEKARATNVIDRDAAVAFAHAATHNDQIERYLTVSALSSRRHLAEWWGTEEAAKIKEMADYIGTYTKAKLAADECLTVWGNERQKRDKDFKYIVLRPGGLMDTYDKGEEAGKIQLGRTNYESGRVILRDDVAQTAVQLLENGATGWFDLLAGKTEVEEAVKKAMESEKSALDGEKEEEMRQTADKAFSEEWEEYCNKLEANQPRE